MTCLWYTLLIYLGSWAKILCNHNISIAIQVRANTTKQWVHIMILAVICSPSTKYHTIYWCRIPIEQIKCGLLWYWKVSMGLTCSCFSMMWYFQANTREIHVHLFKQEKDRTVQFAPCWTVDAQLSPVHFIEWSCMSTNSLRPFNQISASEMKWK